VEFISPRKKKDNIKYFAVKSLRRGIYKENKYKNTETILKRIFKDGYIDTGGLRSANDGTNGGIY